MAWRRRFILRVLTLLRSAAAAATVWAPSLARALAIFRFPPAWYSGEEA